AATTPPTPPKRPRSPATSAGPTAAPDPNSSSPSAPRSADPITYPTLLDAALVGVAGNDTASEGDREGVQGGLELARAFAGAPVGAEVEELLVAAADGRNSCALKRTRT